MDEENHPKVNENGIRMHASSCRDTANGRNGERVWLSEPINVLAAHEGKCKTAKMDMAGERVNRSVAQYTKMGCNAGI